MIFLKLKFNQICQFLGRNGVFEQHGLLVWDSDGKTNFEPITSKGQEGRAKIQIPTEHLSELIEALQQIQAHAADYPNKY